MSKRSKYLLKNTVAFAIGKVGTRLITFFLVPLYTYALSTEEYGTVDLISTICIVLMPILILNIHESVMRFCLDRGADYRKIMSIGLVILAGATVIGLVLIPAAKLFPEIAEYGFLIYAYVITMGYSQVFLYYLRGQEKVTAYSVGNIIHTAVAAGLNILFLVTFHWGVKGYLLAYTCSNIASALYAAVVGRVDLAIRGFRLDSRLSRMMLRFSVILIPNTFMWWIINSSDRVMVAAMVGTAANGIYAVSYKIPSMLSIMSEIFNQAWSYSAIREHGSADEAEYHNRMYNNMVQTLIFITAGVLLVIKPFLKLYVSEEYYSAWTYTPYLLIGFLFLSLATFLATSYTVHKNSLGFLLSSMMGASINILLNLLLIPKIGVTGAALATCLSYITVYLFRGIHTRKYLKIRICQPKHLMGYGLLVAMCGALFVEGIAGAILLLGLFAIVVFYSKDFLMALWNMIRKKSHRDDGKNRTV